jgi:Recombinase zinc beta ribbon domain
LASVGLPPTGRCVLIWTRLLSNPLYIGSVRLKDELHPGEHPAIVDPAVWRKASELLKAHPRSKPGDPPQPQDAILRGLLFCEPCGALMTPAYTKRNPVRVRYYTCLSAQKRGWNVCPSRSLSAIRIENAVLGQVGLGASLALPGSSETVRRLVQRVTYNGSTGAVVVTLHPVQESQPERFAS